MSSHFEVLFFFSFPVDLFLNFLLFFVPCNSIVLTKGFPATISSWHTTLTFFCHSFDGLVVKFAVVFRVRSPHVSTIVFPGIFILISLLNGFLLVTVFPRVCQHRFSLILPSLFFVLFLMFRGLSVVSRTLC